VILVGLAREVVSEMLGHSNVGITLSTYGHVMPGMHREAADRLDALFSGGKKTG
jgi:integrase